MQIQASLKTGGSILERPARGQNPWLNGAKRRPVDNGTDIAKSPSLSELCDEERYSLASPLQRREVLVMQPFQVAWRCLPVERAHNTPQSGCNVDGVGIENLIGANVVRAGRFVDGSDVFIGGGGPGAGNRQKWET